MQPSQILDLTDSRKINLINTFFFAHDPEVRAITANNNKARRVSSK